MLYVAMLAVIGLGGAVEYAARGVLVRRALRRDRASDDPLTRGDAVKLAAMRRTGSVGRAVGTIAVGGTVALVVPEGAGGVGLVISVILGGVVAAVVGRWEDRRTREIRAGEES